ncbi:hypothetical protein [Streptomyces sp. NBC_00568]|uniref:hypothetical protein n=1 Tax=Streptomyces sp. NBC_00568 TaxID=2975779 RepID=UPI00225AE4B5|nr:hypothetical protein [Streptomyces sp. NBC_00568]MCX4993763.1 hypothetical protein [Streptomyces sp. NBC_00568]
MDCQNPDVAAEQRVEADERERQEQEQKLRRQEQEAVESARKADGWLSRFRT